MILTIWLSLFSACMVHAQDTLQLDLQKALEIGLSENPTIKVANKEIQKKKYAQKGSYASLFPQISFSADYTRTLKKQVMYMDGFDMSSMGDAVPEGTDLSGMDKGIEVGRDNNWSTGFNASVPLVNASLWKSLSISAIDVELAIEQARSSKIDMINQIRKAYFGVMLANDSYVVFKESYDNAMENYLDIEKKFNQGTVAEYDLIRADVTVKNNEPNMLQAANALILAKWQLKALMGIDLEMPIECEGNLTDYEQELYADFMSTDTSLEENTELKQLDIQAKQLEKNLTMQKFDYIPTLSMTALYQWSAMNNDFKFGNYLWNPYSIVGLSVSVPLFTGGSRFYKIKQTRVQQLQLDLQKDDMERNLRVAVKQYLDNMETCIKRFTASQKGVEQAIRGYAISQKRFDTGAGTLLELNDSELALTQARLNFNQAIYDYIVSKADLEKVLGKANY